MKMNKKTTWIAGAVLVLGCCAALAAAPLKVITVQVKVASLNGSSNGTFGIGDGVPVQVGEQVRIELTGTAVINGAGVPTPVDARFAVGAGGNNISLGRSGPNWVIVNVNAAGGNGLAQLAFSANGNYEMRPGIESGRITFKIGTNPVIPVPAAPGTVDRVDKARHLNGMLYRTILGVQPSGPQAQADHDRILQNGYRGVVEVADELAHRAESLGRGRALGERGYEQADIERVATLYRGLLGRQESNAALWQSDGGFRGNVEALHQKGLLSVVHGIVSSDEFISRHQLSGF
jgi:hypothetical protein